LNATILPAAANLIDEIAGRLLADRPDIGGALVVFPGKRPGHFLRRRLAEEMGSSFVPPRILSMDELVDLVFETRETRAGRIRPKLEPIDAVAILHDIQLAAARPVGGSAFMTLDSFFSIGLKIHRDLEELMIENVSPRRAAEVQTLVEQEVPPRSRERLQSLAYFYDAFYPAVEENGLSTRSSRYRLVSREIEQSDVPVTAPIILAGFYALSESETALFRRLAAWPAVQLVFQEGRGLRRRIRALAVTGAGETEPAPSRRPEIHFSSSPDAHGQVFALNAALKTPDQRTLIVLPRPDTLFPLVRQCLSRFDEESFNVSLGYPLTRTPLYGFLNTLMELVGSMDEERVYLPDYVSFVLHPYVKNIRLGASAEATRVLFHALEERLAHTRTRRFATLDEIENDRGLFDEAARRITEENRDAMAAALRMHLVDIHERTVWRFRSFTSVRDFSERCIELIAWVHDESTAKDHPYFTPFSDSFVRSLETISRSLMAVKSFNDTASYFALLRRYLQTCYLPFEGTPLHGLQVLGALETRNLQFERVFVLDANEGALPETGSENTLLPFAVRTALGLSTYRDVEDISAYHFETLAAGARELHLFYVQSGGRERSRFVERFLWESQKESGTLDEQSLVRPIQYAVDLTNTPPVPVTKTADMVDWLRVREYSATALDAYLKCPLKFYYKYVLKLGQREETAAEIGAAEIGTFVHKVLFRFFSTRTGRPLSAGDADPSEMARLVDEHFADSFGPAETGANRLLHDQVRRHLRDFVGKYLKTVVTEHRVILRALERDTAAVREGFSLRGRIDLVEDRDGAPYLVDYKTSAHRSAYALKLKKLVIQERSTWSGAIGSLQLPFYVLLYAAETGSAPSEVQAMFLLLGRSEMDARIELPLFADPEEAEAAWPALESVIFGLLKEIVSPEIPFSPAQDLKAVCPWCDFKNICGTAWLTRG